VPDRLKPSFVIFDTQALWRLGLSSRMSKLNRSGTWCLLYSCTHMATVGVKGFNLLDKLWCYRAGRPTMMFGCVQGRLWLVRAGNRIFCLRSDSRSMLCIYRYTSSEKENIDRVPETAAMEQSVPTKITGTATWTSKSARSVFTFGTTYFNRPYCKRTDHLQWTSPVALKS